MVAPLPVLGLVVDDAVLHLHLADGVVALEVGGVVLGVPEAELDGAEEGELRRLSPFVRYPDPPDLHGLPAGDEVERFRADALVPRRDDGIAKAVTAGVALQLALGRLPAGAPEVARGVVAEVDVPAAHVERRVVVPIARQPAETGVAVEGVAARRVRDDPEVFLAAKVVDPWKRRVRTRDDVLAPFVVEVAEAHG